VPHSFHLAALAWVAGMLVLARHAEPTYDALMQEDKVVEWATVAFFLLAGIVRLRTALIHRRVFDGLVALFCLFVAGEEISWGQRLMGYTPPPVFLEHNTQQELTLHNFAEIFGAPKWTLSAALFGYGILLPLAAHAPALRQLLDRIGATPPPTALVPWFAAAVGLLLWYPVTFTGEWVELLAGALFFAASRPATRTLWTGFAASVPAAAAMTWVSGHTTADPARVGCAQLEVGALVYDLTTGAAAPRLLNAGQVHKRILTSGEAGYLHPERLGTYFTADCPSSPPTEAAERRRYGVDPWGTAYWLFSEPLDGSRRRVVVYSFGPNRRRDGEPASGGGDDVRATSDSLLLSPDPF